MRLGPKEICEFLNPNSEHPIASLCLFMKRSETKGAGVSHWAHRDSLALSQWSQWQQKGRRLWYPILLWIFTLACALDSFSHFKLPVFSPTNEDCSHSPFPKGRGCQTRQGREGGKLKPGADYLGAVSPDKAGSLHPWAHGVCHHQHQISQS